MNPTRSLREMYDSKTPPDDEEEKVDDELCVWTEDPDGGGWDTDCGEKFELTSGTPEENRMVYCCFCGRPLRGAEG